MNKDAGKLSALVAGSWAYASDSGFTFLCEIKEVMPGDVQK